METLTTCVVMMVGMVFSLAVGLLVEELIFNKVLGPLFARREGRQKSVQAR
jgi:hypothetical protein